MNDPLVSVIIPLYNSTAFLPKCLDSVLGQSWTKLEVILVDDGSTDGTLALCEQYQRQDPRITVLHQENQGSSAARNAGLDRAAGQYVTYMDGDDWADREHIADLVRGLEGHNADCAICGYRLEWPAGAELRAFPRLGLLDGGQAVVKMMAPELFQGFLWNKLFA